MVLLTDTSDKLEGEELKFAEGFSSKLEVDQLQKLSALLSQLYYHIERNGNPKILFVSNSLRIAAVLKNEEVHIV